MFTLLSPSALLALLGLLVPVAIHLWNRRPGREVAVGSLRWLTAGANRRLRNLKPEQLWLLLLRAALLAVLAVALAGPVWRQVLPTGRGQVLLSPEVIGTPAFAALRPAVDSLRRRGYALRWLTKDFPKMSRATLRADSLGQRDSARLLAAGSSLAAGFYAERIRQAASTFSGQPLYVVTSAALHGFQGELTPLPASVTWQTLPTAATANWVQAAAFRGDTLRVVVGQSTENQTVFRAISVARPQAGAVVRVGGALPYRLVGNELQPVSATAEAGNRGLPTIPVRTKPLRAVIYATAGYALDAKYLQAGLRAAAAGLPVALSLSVTSTPPASATPPDWLFWLADAPLPAAWQDAIRSGTQVWQEAAGPGEAAKARLAPATANEVPATIFKRQRQPSAAPDSYPLWVDGQGRAVLTRRALGSGAYYQLATRLNSTWSDLADNPALPARLLALLQPETTDATLLAQPRALDQALATQDRRALDPTQIRMATAASSQQAFVTGNAAPLAFRETDLRPWFMLLAGLLLAFERLLARRRENLTQSSTV